MFQKLISNCLFALTELVPMEHPAILILGLIIEGESKSLIFPNILSESYHSKSCNPPIACQ